VVQASLQAAVPLAGVLPFLVKHILSSHVHVQSEAKIKLGHREEAEGSPKRSSLKSEAHELNISDEFSLFLSFAEKERKYIE
jgi:hypothetical protein